MNIGAKTLNKMLTNGIQCYIKGKGNLTPIYKASSQQKNQSWQEKQSVKWRQLQKGRKYLQTIYLIKG